MPTTGPAYEGRAGQTRTEKVHLVDPDDRVRSIEVYRVVNVGTHPELRARLLAGQLHRLEDGRELALPFVYHDPVAKKFALVVPPSLAHLEMKEWARLMTEVAEDTNHAVPAYVRDGTTVLGLPALELFLEGGVEPDDEELSPIAQSADKERQKKLQERDTSLTDRERVLQGREREIAEQEQSLVRMARELTERDASIARREQQLTSERAELEAKLALAEAKARDVVVKEPLRATGKWQEAREAAPTSLTFETDQATVVAPMASIPAMQVQDSELHDMPGDGGAVARAAGEPPPLKRRAARNPPPLRPGSAPVRATSVPLRPASAPIVVTPAIVATPVATATAASVARRASSAPPPLPRAEVPAPRGFEGAAASQPVSPASQAANEALRSSMLPPHVPDPPAGFAELGALGMAVRFEKNELWLFVQLDEKHEDVYDEEAELLVQLLDVDGRPVVMFALLGSNGAVARAAVDGVSSETRAMLERIERVFRAQVALYVDGEQRATRMILAPREANARAILERLTRARPSNAISAQEAIERALKRPPAVRDDQLPFGPPRPQAASTSSVLSGLERLAQWAQPDKLEQALLVYSIPKHVIDASVRRVLRAAIGFGIALPARLAELAIEHKLAENAGQLVQEQLAAFKQRVERGQNDLDAQATMRNWEQLFAQAESLDLVLDPGLRPLVERTAAESGAPPPDLPLSASELRRDLGDPGRRLDAIRELCRRGHPSALAPIFEVLEELSPAELTSAVIAVLAFGEQSADGLVSALTSPSQHVRHACALGLGQLKVRRSLLALIKQIETESTPSWAEMARALGDFGSAALRAVSRSIQSSDRRERLMVGLAHLANHGCAEEVKTLETDPDPAVALAARQAMARCSRMEWDDQAVRNQQQLRDNSPETRFSQVFYAELARAGA